MTDHHAARDNATQSTTTQTVAQDDRGDGVPVVVCPAEVKPGWVERVTEFQDLYGPVLGSIGIAFGGYGIAAADALFWSGGASGLLLLGAGLLRSQERVRRIARVSERAVTVEGLGAVRADDVLRCVLTRKPKGGASLTLVRRRGPSVALGLKDETDGARLVLAMGLGVSETRSVWRGFPCPRRALSLPAMAALFFLLLSGMAARLPVSVIAVGFLVGPLVDVLWRLSARSVEIGSDGVLLRGRLRSRFVSYRELRALGDSAGWLGSRVALTLEDGRRVFVFVEGDEQRRDLRRALDEAFSAHRAADDLAAHAALARGSRAIPEWLVTLRRLGSGAGTDYRAPPLAPETLLRIASDAGEAPTHRAAAAIAFATAASTSERSQLAITARAIAHPTLCRAVLAAAHDEKPAQLAAALEAVAEEEASRAESQPRSRGVDFSDLSPNQPLINRSQ
jgi:hypothetical protein